MIREFRKRAGLSRYQLAKHAMISPAAIAAYETGRRQPSAVAFLRLAWTAMQKGLREDAVVFRDAAVQLVGIEPDLLIRVLNLKRQ